MSKTAHRRPAKRATPDLLVHVPQPNGGTIGTVLPQTPAGHQWIAENVQDPQYFGRALVVETRYLYDLLKGAREDGLTLAPGGVVS